MLNNDLIIGVSQVVSSFGDYKRVIAVTVLFILGVFISKKLWLQSVLFVSSIGSFALAQIIKGIFKLPRPMDVNLRYHTAFDQYGFPSGHVLFYTAFFGYLTWVFCFSKNKRAFSTPFKVLVAVVSGSLIGLIGVSRVVLHAHFIIDVIGGYIFGVTYLLVLILCDLKVNYFNKPWPKN